MGRKMRNNLRNKEKQHTVGKFVGGGVEQHELICEGRV
jgi:hypothetical protein